MRNLLLRLAKLYIEDMITLAKIKAAGYYVKAVGEVRSLFIHAVLIKCALLLMLAGFVLMHLAIFVFIPWSPETKATVLFILGGVYFLIPSLYVLKMCSEKYWMELTRATDLVNKTIGKK
jgi:hypothetical protein